MKALGCQITAHCFNIVDSKADVTHHIRWMSRRLIEQFDVLVIVDFYESDAHFIAVLLVQTVRFVEAEEVVPKCNGFGKVGYEVAHMGDAGDPGSRRRRLLRTKWKNTGAQQGGETGKNGSAREATQHETIPFRWFDS